MGARWGGWVGEGQLCWRATRPTISAEKLHEHASGLMPTPATILTWDIWQQQWCKPGSVCMTHTYPAYLVNPVCAKVQGWKERGVLVSSGDWKAHAVDDSPAAIACQPAKSPLGGGAWLDQWLGGTPLGTIPPSVC